MRRYEHTHRLTKEEAMYWAVLIEVQMQKKILSLREIKEADHGYYRLYWMEYDCHLSYVAIPTLEAVNTRPPYPEGEYSEHDWTIVSFYDRTVCGEPYYTVGIGNVDQEEIDELFSDEAINSLEVETPAFDWYWGCYMSIACKRSCESQDQWNRVESEAYDIEVEALQDECGIEERYGLMPEEDPFLGTQHDLSPDEMEYWEEVKRDAEERHYTIEELYNLE